MNSIYYPLIDLTTRHPHLGGHTARYNFGSSKTPTLQPLREPPKATDVEIQASKASLRERQARASGSSSTKLTTPGSLYGTGLRSTLG